MKFTYDDGGREDAGYKGDAGDCVVRAIAIATEIPYKEVYEDLMERNRAYYEATRSRKRTKRTGTPRTATPREGVFRKSTSRTCKIRLDVGADHAHRSGCTVHMRADELPNGRIITRLSKHVCAVIDGVIHDTHNPSRDGTRCVYGMFTKE